jgi:uncharacterized repeat protein (TIGR02543 family)
MTAQPNPGYFFTSWSGDVTGSTNPTTITINNNVNVTANFAVNQAPVIKPGAYDAPVMLSASLSLNAKVTDDGLPNPGTLQTSWSVVSGPGNVKITNANQTLSDQAGIPVGVNGTASFSQAGTYVLQLSASDGQLNSSKQIMVTVVAQPTAQK